MLAVGAIAGLSGAALADVKAGVDAWADGNYDAAVREWQSPANAGDPDAQFNLAQAYKLGRGVPRDLGKAETLYASAAAKGHLQASDNYGLLLFQRGARAQAMPYIEAAAGRGDPRAQYIIGLALFNGDGMAKDWVRAYAYVTLAQQAGLPQANGALAQMDQHVGMADRQKSIAVAAQIAAQTSSTRARQVAAADLDPIPESNVVDRRTGVTREVAASDRPILATRPDRAGADAARAATAARDARATRVAAAGTAVPCTSSRPCPGSPALSASPRRVPPVATPRAPDREATPARTGSWRLQLGAFGVSGNAEALWSRVKGRPELAGHGKLLAPAGKLTKLQATGFASAAEANAACARLKSGGFTCLATRD